MSKVRITMSTTSLRKWLLKSLILKVTSMRNLTTPVGDVLLDFNSIICIEINYIHKTKLNLTLKYY